MFQQRWQKVPCFFFEQRTFVWTRQEKGKPKKVKQTPQIVYNDIMGL